MKWIALVILGVICVAISGLLLDWYDNRPLNDFEESVEISTIENAIKEVSVLDLNLEDFGRIKKINYKLFVMRNGVNYELKYEDSDVLNVVLSPAQNQFAFTYNSGEGSWVIELRIAKLHQSESNLITDQFTFSHRMPAGGVAWWGNDYIHMMRGCGTGCTEIILINIKTGEIRNGAVFHEYYIKEESELIFGEFVDWFGVRHETDYFIGSPRVDVKDGWLYFVLEMLDKDLNKIGEDRWLFTEESLMKIE